MHDKLIAEAKDARRLVAEREAEHSALVREEAQLVERFERATDLSSYSGASNPEGDELHSRLTEVRVRLARASDALSDERARLADLDKLAAAPERAAQAERDVEAARAVVGRVESAIGEVERTIAGLRQREADERVAAEGARAATAVRALDDLPAEVHELLGHQPADPASAPPADPRDHEARAAALDAAADRLDTKLIELHAELEGARAAEAAALRLLDEQRAYVAEVKHASALAAYLPALSAYRDAHRQAFDFVPELPRFAELCDQWRTDRLRDEDDVQPHGSLLRRAGRKVTAAVGL